MDRPDSPQDRPRPRRPRQDATEPRTGEPSTASRSMVAMIAHDPDRGRRFRPAIETVLLASTAALLAAVAWPIATAGLMAAPEATPPASSPAAIVATATPATVAPTEAPTIQIALLLDTSSSMSGLIDQARSQLWRVVNALDSATYHGATPRLELALYEYGNDGLEGSDGFIRQVTAFTPELDRVSEALFALSTNGGSEYAGQAIARSVDDLQWREGDGTLKVLYIAGNESFAQGPVDWRDAIESARANGIVVNTVLCDGVDDQWSAAATLAGGRFMQIDHNAVAEYVEAPQDEQIRKLGLALNETYIGFGAQGRWGVGNQLAQDSNVAGYGEGSSVQRAMTKGSRHYVNPTWDLVDATADGTFDVTTLEEEALPEAYRGLTTEQLTERVEAKRRERTQLSETLTKLGTERESYVAKELARRHGEDPHRLDTAIVASVVEQAKAAGFTIGSTAS